MKKETIEGLLKLAENEDAEMRSFLIRMATSKLLFVAEISEGIFQWTTGLPQEFTYRVLDWDIVEHDMLLRDLDADEEVIKRAKENNGYIGDLEEQVEICLTNLLKID